MKLKSLFLAATVLCGAVSFQSCSGTEAKDKATTQNTQSQAPEEFSYALGLLIGNNLKQSGMTSAELNTDAFKKGLVEALEGTATMDINQADQIVQTQMQALQMRAAEASKAKHAGNLEAGKKFLEENAKKPGVKTTASGLQYEVLKDGSGAKPTLQSKVKVHYHGTFIDGKVFDSSVNRGEPITFPLNGVIQGWQEGVQLMPVGSKYRFYIPYNLAYGERGMGANIPPFSALIFDVELLAIEK